jgi:hypothetical protein
VIDSYSPADGIPVAASRAILTDLLGELAFRAWWSDDNSVPCLLDPQMAAADAVRAVGWALHAGIDVVSDRGARLQAYLLGICPYHFRAPSGGPSSDLAGVRPVCRDRASESHGRASTTVTTQRCCLVAPGQSEGSEAVYDERSGVAAATQTQPDTGQLRAA